MANKKTGDGPVAVRRERSTISKQLLRDMANEAIAGRIQGLASSLEGDFVVMALERLGRTPTEGEKGMFLRAVAMAIKGLKKKVK